jgi:alpha-beta hydrolase superfamily lysophospholipase
MMVSQPPRRASWLQELLSGLAVASGIGYVAGAYSVSRWLTRSTPGRPRRTPADLDLPWERLECRTVDGLRLVGWAVTPPRPRATVALFHGLRANRAQTLDRTAFLYAEGYRCVAFDHRGHGESGGRRTSFGYYESRDVRAVLDLIRRRWPWEPHAALGISMGAAALCFAGRRAHGFDAVVLESLYHDLRSAFSTRIGTNYPAWFRRFSGGTVWVTERRLGVRLQQVAPAEHIAELAPAPVLLVTGAEDCHAPPEDACRLFERCQEPRELWVVPDAGHGDVYEKGGPLYQQRVLGFLKRWLAA